MEDTEKPTLDDFLLVHEGQLLASKIPQHFWPTIFQKLKTQTLDAGSFFQVIMEELENGNKFSALALRDLSSDDPNNIFLIDHAWTFRLNSARVALEKIDSLRENLTSIFDIKGKSGSIISLASSIASVESIATANEPATSAISENKSESDAKEREEESLRERTINLILDEMWRYAQTYTIRVANKSIDESDMPVWYVLDDFGMRIGHSITPNCRMVPFFYAFEGKAYSLLFPISTISDTEEITRNYLDNTLFREHPDWLPYLMNPWIPFNGEWPSKEILFSKKSDDYFLSGRVEDELLSNTAPLLLSAKQLGGESVRVFADDFQLIDKLKSVNVEEVKDMLNADVIWLREHFHSFKELAERNSAALINQFPYESSLTVKDLFAAIVQSVYAKDGPNPVTFEWAPKWFPITFNLQLELPQFIQYYFEREKRGLDNTWIIKPCNLARGLDVFVTRNINCIIRLAESGPKIVSKYIHNPVLFKRPDNGNFVKFDLRYIVFVKSLKPIEIAIYNKFWIRFAVNQFNLNRLDDSLTHLTVHNYNPEVEVLKMDCQEFVDKFEDLHKKFKWTDIENKIKNVIKEVLSAATTYDPPRGIASNPQSRAMYGFDFMLRWEGEDIEVSFIEANFMPDCTRACEFYSDFADTVFETLFFNNNSSYVSKI